MRIQPLEDRLVLKLCEPATVSSGGVILPPGHQPEELYEVQAAGPKATLTVGQKVVCAKFSGTELKLDNIEYLVVNEPNVLAIIADH